MKNIRKAILAVCIGTLGSLALQAQSNTNTAYGGEALISNTSGFKNSAFGYQALQNNTSGANSAFGYQALQNNTGGDDNSAFGGLAMQNNTTGHDNSAFGDYALQLNTTGFADSAFGHMALQLNTTGDFDSAFGLAALEYNTTGSNNTAIGYTALWNNTSGSYNTAFGSGALLDNQTGGQNTAVGFDALYANTGTNNTASGYNALYSTTGNSNTGFGTYALYNNTTGIYNIGVGMFSGYYNPVGSNFNIDIGNYGSGNDNGVIRIGTPGWESSFYAAGINGVGVSGGIPVYINSNGQLGTVNSSIRFKEDVHDMAAASDGLMKLRPVTYRYKQPYDDGSKPVDYGLIAEEVAEVYPDLVVKNADGQIQTVQYQKLTPMLLNEVQKEHKQLEEQKTTIQELEKRLAALEAALPSVKPEADSETR
ncbi:MAG: tail fiber domain-containing protein [Terracidiphilus sp.]